MAKVNLSLLLVLVSIVSAVTATVKPAVHRRSRARTFVETECGGTRYPELCVKCLANSVNATAQGQQHLAQIALRVSLARARYARAYMIQVIKELKQTKAKEYQAVKDCLVQINDGVDQLTRSVKELQRINENGETHFFWHQSNVQTWTSAALTDALTCMDGFSGHAMAGKKKAIIKAKVLNVAQVTSNALALFNRYAARHRASHAKKP